MSSFETYGDFRLDFLYDECGRSLWNDHLFLNIYDFWCVRQMGFLLTDYKTKNLILKKILRKKLRGNKELPTYKILLRMIIKKDEQFNPMEFLEKDSGDYFNILREWKKVCEEDFILMYPHLRELKRHIKSKIFYIN